VFDLWAQQWRKRHARGDMIVVRCWTTVFSDSNTKLMPTVSGRYACAIGGILTSRCIPEKTRIIRFGRYAALNRRERGQGKPETFTFLGFYKIYDMRAKNEWADSSSSEDAT